MIHPKHNRLDFGQHLVPPAGYSFEQGIGTTYSLDLEALLVLPVALFYAQPVEGDPSAIRYDMLDSLTKVAKKIMIFHQQGHVKVPKKFHHLIAFWEKGLYPVKMDSVFESFHSKVWVIQFSHPVEPPIFRVMVTSRNLTFARDWDIAFVTEGEVGTEPVKQNFPLVHFLESVAHKANAKFPPAFLHQLSCVMFNLELDVFRKVLFHPIGIRALSTDLIYTAPLFKKKWWDEILIISPFVDNATLKHLVSISGKKRFLVSRKEELDTIDLDILHQFTCYQFSKTVEISELDESLNADDTGTMTQNLHCKLFITRLDDQVHWFMGSANCTDPARGRNIEFQVEFRGADQKGLKPGDIVQLLTTDERKDSTILFEPYDEKQRTDTTVQKMLDLELRSIRYAISSMTQSGSVHKIEGGTAYDMKISVDARDFFLPTGFEVRFKPLSEEDKLAVTLKPGELNITDIFGGYAETRLSPFLEWEIWWENKKFVGFLIEMDIELPMSRLNRIFSSIINSREKFMQYLGFLLTGDDPLIIEDTSINQARQGDGKQGHFDQHPVYEKLMLAASRYPEKLDAIDQLVKRLHRETAEDKEPIISPAFEEVWQVFTTYQQSLQDGR